MDSEKTIRIGVDAKEVETTFDRIRKIASETAASMIADAEKRVGTSHEMIKSLEDEIKLMEREQHMATLERRTNVEERLKSATYGDRAGLQKELTEIKIDDKEAKIHTELLRDIVDAVLGSGKKEVEENRKGTQELVSGTAVRNRTFKQRYQASLLGLDGEHPDEETRRGGMMAGGMRGYGAAVIGARGNLFDAGIGVAQQTGGMMAGMGGGLAIAGIGIGLAAMLGKQLWEGSRKYYEAELASYAVSGEKNVSVGAATNYSKYGYSASEYAGRFVPLMRARRSAAGTKEAVEHQMLLERGIGLDMSTYAGMEQLGVLGGETGFGNIQRGISGMRAAGMVKGGDMSAVPDFLQIMIQLGKEQVSRLGKVDMGINMKMVAMLGSMDETLKKSPEAVSTMINAIRGGLTGAGSPQSQALQYSVLSKIKPGADIFELMEMKENPFSKENQKYLPDYLGQLKKMSGGNDHQFFLNIMKQFGLSAAMSRTLGQGFNIGKLDKILDENFNKEGGVKDLEGRAKEATTAQAELAAKAENAQIEIADGVKTLVTLVGDLVNGKTEVVGATQINIAGLPVIIPTIIPKKKVF